MTLAIGDRVEVGKYRLRRRFREAAVFSLEAPAGEPRRGPSYLCLVADSKGQGPVNVTTRDLDMIRHDALEVRRDRILIGGRQVRIRRRYDSGLPFLRADEKRFARNLAAFRRALLDAAAPKSLAFLLDPRRENDFTPGFEQELIGAIRAGVRQMLDGDLETGAEKVKGLGFGLTPSGDDFLAGFMLGLHTLQSAFDLDLRDDIRAIRRAARSLNPLSDALLACAAEGRFFERAKTLVRALVEGDEPAVTRATQGLTAIGASSGADLGVGLFLALHSHEAEPWR